MIGALAGRLAALAVTAWLAATLTFVLVHAAPGGPAVALAGDFGAPGLVEEIARRHGLDRPLWEQYLAHLGRLARGDLGHSYRAQMPVLAMILERLPVTLALVLPAGFLAAGAGMLLGTRLALSVAPSRGWLGALAAVHALPGYLVGHALILVFAVTLGWLPVQGIGDARSVTPPGVGEWMRHLVLPVVALALHNAAFVALLTRRVLHGELARPYALAARARGAGRLRVAVRHAMPNALPPIASLIGMRLGTVIAGAIVVETAFALPGLGRLLVTAVAARDHPVTIGIVVVGCLVVVAVNLGVDAIVERLDPRRVRP